MHFLISFPHKMQVLLRLSIWSFFKHFPFLWVSDSSWSIWEPLELSLGLFFFPLVPGFIWQICRIFSDSLNLVETFFKRSEQKETNINWNNRNWNDNHQLKQPSDQTIGSFCTSVFDLGLASKRSDLAIASYGLVGRCLRAHKSNEVRVDEIFELWKSFPWISKCGRIFFCGYFWGDFFCLQFFSNCQPMVGNLLFQAHPQVIKRFGQLTWAMENQPCVHI